ncbi:NACHT domain-containing protein [Pseudomassariella vexata]|uniref:NACHT domain-domain-containing protein n=1 Tax=Pseudomassariella vexata TaxID=1141098 RepID=A0A1Y2EJL9_9PEZI|nr:NACHT domain-containing protein [Pseudomassariella vexata]ORY71005.1 NACHT domain-domain-containing protein [Pseudomassariella vexata]
MGSACKRHRSDEQEHDLAVSDRPGKRQASERAMQAEHHGTGIQLVGSGNITIRGDANFGARHNQCLADLRSTDPRHDKTRIQDAKGGLLEDSYRWILEHAYFIQWRDDPLSRLLWIKGDPGKGKTMLLCGIIEELDKKLKSNTEGGNLSFFFCQATDSRINNATAVLRGLVFLLVEQQPSLISHIRKMYDHAGKQLFEDANAWVALSEILSDILQNPALQSTYLIIDAVDECETGLLQLLKFIIQKSSVSSQVKWIVSSRNWLQIEEQFNTAKQRVRLSLELNAESVATAVDIYNNYKVDRLASMKNYKDATTRAIRDHLSSNANNTFLWVALVCEELEKLMSFETHKALRTYLPGLDTLYERMLQQIHSSSSADLYKRVLAVVSVVYRPVTLQELVSLDESLQGFSENLPEFEKVITSCGCLLNVREETVHFVHQSAKDFLLKKSDDQLFPLGLKHEHRAVFLRSLQILSSTLHRDLYSLQHPGCLIEQIQPPIPDPLATVRYSCIYWADHLRHRRNAMR